MNENVTSFLNEYIKNPNPQYAVFICGQWGCGKTFFIKKWLSSLKEDDTGDFITRKPIYVSLYGLNNTGAINNAIEREIKPWLYSKGMNIAKKVIKAFGKATIRYDFDIDGDKENAQSEQLSYTLDIMSLFGNDGDNIRGERILVLDDLERCHIDMEELLGYINFFVEHSKCKVIVIGDNTKLEESSDKVFQQHKEKLFGREFSIIPDVDSAISSFIEEIGSDGCNRLAQNVNMIKDIFKLSEKKNLRIVRQAIYDYNQCIWKVHILSGNKKYAYVAQTLLCNFLITYLEYKTGNKIFEEWKNKRMMSYVKKDESFDFTHKYNALTYNIEIFEDDLITYIMDYMLRGTFDVSYLKDLLKDDKEKLPWEILQHYWQLDNDTFEEILKETIDALKEDKIELIGDVITTVIFLLTIDSDGVAKLDKEWIIKTLQTKIVSYLDNIKDESELYIAQHQICNRINMYSDSKFYTILEDVSTFTQNYCTKRINNSKSKTALFFETVSDTNVHQLYNLLQEALPDRSRCYHMGAIFVDVDVEKCVSSILKLNNASRTNLLDTLEYHYRREVLGPSNAIDFIQNYKEDITPMKMIGERLSSEVANYKLIDAMTIGKIAEFLKDTSQKMEDLTNKKYEI